MAIYLDDKTDLAQYTVIETQNSKNLWFMDFVIYNHITYFCDGSTLKIFYFLKLWRQIENKPDIDKNLENISRATLYTCKLLCYLK